MKDAEVEKIFFSLRVGDQRQIFSAIFFYKFWQGFSLRYSINTNKNCILFNAWFEFTIMLEFLLAKDPIPWCFPKYFLPNQVTLAESTTFSTSVWRPENPATQKMKWTTTPLNMAILLKLKFGRKLSPSLKFLDRVNSPTKDTGNSPPEIAEIDLSPLQSKN